MNTEAVSGAVSGSITSQIVIPQGPQFLVRPMAQSDLDQVAGLEKSCLPDGYQLSRTEIGKIYKLVTAFGFVVDDLSMQAGSAVVGYALCNKVRGVLNLLRFGVSKSSRRAKAGTMLIDEVKRSGSQLELDKIVVTVPERILEAQLFLRRQGFWAVQVRHNVHDRSGDDGYQLEYLLVDALADRKDPKARVAA